MKKVLYIIGLGLFALAFSTGCDALDERKTDGGATQAGKEFTVFMTPYTRATLLDDYSVEWEAGDRIALYDGNSWHGYETVEGGHPAKFVGEAALADKYVAVYPYSDAILRTDEGVVVEIPSVQSVALADPSPEADVWVGESRGAIIEMNNICGHMLLSLEAEDITAITIEGMNGEPLSGKIEAVLSSDGLVVEPVEESSTSIRLVPASGETFTSGSYCFACAPFSIEHGLMLSFDRLEGISVQRPYAEPLDLSVSAMANIGHWDLSAPELRSVTTGEVKLTGDKAVLSGAMSVVNFNAEKMTCGFEYKTDSAQEWTRVTCEDVAQEFSYTLTVESAQTHIFRAWAQVNGMDIVYGETGKEFAPETFVLNLVFNGQEGRDLLVKTWGWKTNGNNSSAKRGYDMNNLTYNYTYNGVDYPFTFWALQSGVNAEGVEATSGGYCFRHTTNVPDEALCLSNLGKDYAPDGHPAWMQFPGPAGMKLIEVNAELKNNFSGHICTAVNEDGTWAGDSLAEYTGKKSFPVALKNTSAGVRYYFTTEHIDLPRILSLTLTYIYTE